MSPGEARRALVSPNQFLAAFGAAVPAQWARLEFTYATSELVSGDGFRWDNLTVSHIQIPVFDNPSDSCAPLGSPDPMPFGDGFELGSTAYWSSINP